MGDVLTADQRRPHSSGDRRHLRLTELQMKRILALGELLPKIRETCRRDEITPKPLAISPWLRKPSRRIGWHCLPIRGNTRHAAIS
ncbi:hypothetical protein MES5069_190148 [Mesorhizobium escarrei]|uniref:Uncharacterized protein n=1 Tax=Mesorhizobium escarrei TaxID=666018 RepID=A0ABM9DNH1_9HYPH|nr:hypothetical protein MES5069_190148 [Mesorhizobium escarrei]